MKFGHFDDARREYVITTPRTPLPWINYLGNEDFFTLLSNTAGGYSFYREAAGSDGTRPVQLQTRPGLYGDRGLKKRDLREAGVSGADG